MTAWIDFVKEYANDNNISYKQALIDAKDDYKISKSIEKKINKKPRKVKLNIIEPEPITRPKIEPPPVQTKELKETFDYKLKLNERKKKLTKKQKLKKPPNYPPSIIEEDESIEEPEPEKKIPSIVSKQEDELMKTTIPKLKEILKELNFTKFSKFKKQDYIDKILELKNGIWWRYKYPIHYERLQQVNEYLKNPEILLEAINKATEEARNSTNYNYQLILDNLKNKKKIFDLLADFDFEKDIQRLENMNKPPIRRPAIEPPPVQTKELKETTVTKEEPIKKKRKPRSVNLIIEKEDSPTPASPYKNIIEEWDTVNLPYLLFQEQPKIYEAIEKKILTLAKRKSSIVIPDLLFFIKPFLNELFVHYGSNKTALDIIQNGMVYLVTEMGYNQNKIFKDDTDYIGKHFNKANKKTIYNILKKDENKPPF
jgi:hypothetical protein